MEKVKLFDIQEVKWNNDAEGLRSCVFKPTKQATMQYWELAPGVGAPPHNHPAEQLIYIQSGRVDVTVDDVTYELTGGCFCLVPSNAIHSTKNVGTNVAVNVDIFLPERDDRTNSERVLDLGHKNW